MVIFHSYVSLPEGISKQTQNGVWAVETESPTQQRRNGLSQSSWCFLSGSGETWGASLWGMVHTIFCQFKTSKANLKTMNNHTNLIQFVGDLG